MGKEREIVRNFWKFSNLDILTVFTGIDTYTSHLGLINCKLLQKDVFGVGADVWLGYHRE